MSDDDTEEMVEERIRAWRRALLVGAVLVALQLPLEFHYAGWAVSFPLRIAWVMLLLACVLLVDPGRPRLVKGLAHAAGLGSGLLASGIIAATGSSHGPRFGFLLAFPLVVLVLAPDLPWAAGATGLATTLGGLVLMVRDQQDVWFISEWGILSVTATGLAILGTLASRRLRSGERRARAAHAVTASKLAEAERAVVVGRLASAVAHRVSNPLSVVKANLWFLLTSRDARDLDPDAVEMLRESAWAVERVVRVLAELRALARNEPEAPMRCDVAEAIQQSASSLAAGGLEVDVDPEFPSDLPSVWVGPQGLILSLVAVLADAAASASGRERSSTPLVRITGRQDGDFVELLVAERATFGATMPLGPPLPPTSSGAAEQRYAADLAIAREILERSGGSLDVDASSTGTTVRIRLRVAATAT